jgi:hypothetical protein
MIESNGSKVRRWMRLCALLALAFSASAGTAQGADVSPAPDALGATSWSRAYAKKEWPIAVALLEAIPEAARTPWQWFHLARAREKLLSLVEAVDAYEHARELASSSSEAGAPARELLRKLDEGAAAAARRIPWAEIEVSADIPRGAYVFVDDDWLPPSRLRSPYPVNPGWHTFLLEVDGEVLAARRVYFEESQQRLVSLVLEAEPKALALGREPWSPGSDQPAMRPRARSGVRYTEQQRDLRAASYFAFGAGALGMLMGTGFAIRSAGLRSDLSQIETPCSFGGCGYADGADLRQQIRASNQIANASFVLGGLSAVTGGVFFYLSTKDEPERTERASLQPMLGLGSAGVAGRF